MKAMAALVPDLQATRSTTNNSKLEIECIINKFIKLNVMQQKYF
jgi:hypothetical protein